MLRKILFPIVGILFAATPAAAAWQKASTAHFVIYADEDPKKLREFAERLERFDKAVRLARGMSDPKMGFGNRLTVFIVPDTDAVKELARGMPNLTPDLAGFYLSKIEGSVAVVPERSGNSQKSAIDDQSTFYHEYAHHLMYFDISHPTPLWYSEGFAEFMSTADFEKNGTVLLGRAATGRALDVDDRKTFPLEKMLAGNHENLSRDEWSALYARGWLLTHYLTFENSRKGQLPNYLKSIAEGEESLAAAKIHFGDLAQLDRNLHGYLGRNRMSAYKVDGSALTPGPIKIEPLSAGAAAIMPLFIRVRVDSDKSARESIGTELKPLASRYPADPFVQTTLAQALHAVEDYVGSEQAADRALAADPNRIDALIYKGRSILEQAANDENGKTFDEARKFFMRANKLDTEDPEPLLYFYEAHLRDRGRPNENAIAALHYAADLAPQVTGLRIQSAFQYLESGKLADARKRLVPIAFDPHGGNYSEYARRAIEAIDAGDGKKAQSALRGMAD